MPTAFAIRDNRYVEELFSQRNFFYLNGLVVLLIVAFLVWRPRSSSKFRLRGSHKGSKLSSGGGATGGSERAPVRANESASAAARPDQSGRALNVLFNFNGHTWDAYEVLGVPAGANWEEVKKAHAQALNQLSEASSREFLDMALDSIRKHIK